jgi:hypothetical protein
MLVRLLSMAARGTAGEEEPGDLTGRSENGVLNLHEVSQSERGASSQKPGKNRARFGRGKVEPRYERPIARKYFEQGARGGHVFSVSSPGCRGFSQNKTKERNDL